MSNKTLFVVIGVILLIVVALVIFAGARGEETATVGPASNNTYGNPDSKVVLIEAYSLACSACGSFHPILKEIREEYKDRILFQVVHYTLSGTSRSGGLQNAKVAHRAVEAAARQDKFWEMHDILFENQTIWTAQTTSDPIPQIRVFAEEIGLDMAVFDKDFASPEINDIITGDETYLKSLGVSATPTFFLNGEKVESSRLASVDIARSTLDEALRLAEEAGEEEEDATAAPSSNHIIGTSSQDILVREAYSLACSACARHQPLLKQIHEEYSDRVRFQALHYPLGEIFANAEAAHRAIEAASRQDKFWELNDLFFENQNTWRNMEAGAFNQQVEAYAEEVGLDLEQFRADFASPEVAAIVAGDEQYLDDLGVSATPSFFLNGDIATDQFLSLEGARQILDDALNGVTEGDSI